MIVVPPTVLAEVPPGSGDLCEEVTGPVAPAVLVYGEEAALAALHDTPDGLSPVCTRATSSAPAELVSDSRPGMFANQPSACVGPGGALRRGEAERAGT
jgi:acyl-CoA reductase-like NAD-dependent aldehyde dehydrogenase